MMPTRTSFAVAPLDPRAASRLARRRQRQELSVLYESKAEADHRADMLSLGVKQQREAERDEAEQRRREEEHRRQRADNEARKQRLAAQHDRHRKAMIALADEKRRARRSVFILAGLFAAMLWGRDQIGGLLEHLRTGGMKLPVFHVDLSAGPTPENVGAIQQLVASLVDDDGDAVAEALGAEEADLRERLAELQSEVPT